MPAGILVRQLDMTPPKTRAPTPRARRWAATDGPYGPAPMTTAGMLLVPVLPGLVLLVLVLVVPVLLVTVCSVLRVLTPPGASLAVADIGQGEAGEPRHHGHERERVVGRQPRELGTSGPARGRRGRVAAAALADPGEQVDVLDHDPAPVDLITRRHVLAGHVQVQGPQDIDARGRLEQAELVPHPRVEVDQLVLAVPPVVAHVEVRHPVEPHRFAEAPGQLGQLR